MKRPALSWIVGLVRRLMVDRRARLATAVAAALCLASVAAPSATASDARSELQSVASDVPSPQCGDTITTSVRLRTDLICSDDGLIVGADNIVIDLAGHTITGYFGYGIGIADGVSGPSHSNLTIRDGTINGYFSIGVSLRGSQVVNLVNLRVLSIRYGGFMGICLELVNTIGVTVRGGHITNNWNYGSQGAVIDASGDDLRIFDTAISGANPTPVAGRVSLDGGATIRGGSIRNVVVDWTERLVVVDSALLTSSIVAAGAPVGEGVYSATLTGNTFSSSPGCIIACDYRPSIVAILGEPGMQIVDVEIRGNTFDRAGAAGVFVQAPAGTVTGMVIAGNTFSNNGYVGYPPYLLPPLDINGSLVNDGLHITVPPGTDITVADNHASNNADYGIEAVPGTVIDGGGNVSSGGPSSCLGVICTYPA
jgi:hypothetical protein